MYVYLLLYRYTPRNFYSHSPASYPSTPLLSSHAESALLFERMPMDALFFVFYFQQVRAARSLTILYALFYFM